jgi:hypothetical protein
MGHPPEFTYHNEASVTCGRIRVWYRLGKSPTFAESAKMGHPRPAPLEKVNLAISADPMPAVDPNAAI